MKKPYCLWCCLLLSGSLLSSESMTESTPPETELVDIRSINNRIQVDLKYATADNFTGQKLYDFQCCLVLKNVAQALNDVQTELETRNLGLKIWDAYRPMAVQWKFWELIPDERYVANPRKGGRHTRGTAVDVTLIDQYGCELAMPTSFDNFTEKAHSDYMGATAEEIQNREILHSVMEKHGFISLATEWWHFDFKEWKKYPPIDIPIATDQEKD